MASKNEKLPITKHTKGVSENKDENEGGPPLIRFLRRQKRENLYAAWAWILTYLAYSCFHMDRRVLSVVKSSLYTLNCTSKILSYLNHAGYSSSNINPSEFISINDSNLNMLCPQWKPFNEHNGSYLLAVMDVSFLLIYGFGMILSAYIAERVNKRYFLTFGMLAMILSTALTGMAYFAKIHSYAYFIIFQMLNGIAQSTGWPSMIAIIANWFGKGRRGFFFGLWSSNTSVGNILGLLIPGVWAQGHWGWSFIIPALITGVFAILIFFSLVVEPNEVGCPEPRQHDYEVVQTITKDDQQEQLSKTNKSATSPSKAVTITDALKIEGVVSFALAVFFDKFTSYTFLFWLPFYLDSILIGGVRYNGKIAAFISIFFDIGGIIGVIVAGIIFDKTNKKAIISMTLYAISIPTLYLYHFYGRINLASNIVLMIISGIAINGPLMLTVGAVAAELGNSPTLKNNEKATATVSGILDATASIGSALGPLLTGVILPTGWNNVFYMLMGSQIISTLILIYPSVKEIRIMRNKASNGKTYTLMKMEE